MERVKVVLTILFIVFFLIILTFLFYESLFDKNDINLDGIYDDYTENKKQIIDTPKTTFTENTIDEKTPIVKVYESYDEIVKRFKRTYVECVNEDKNTVYEFLMEGSDYEKDIKAKIKTLKEENIKMDLKKIEVLDIEKDGEFLFFYVEEETGKKILEEDFKYEYLKIKYKVEVTELGYIFEDEEEF